MRQTRSVEVPMPCMACRQSCACSGKYQGGRHWQCQISRIIGCASVLVSARAPRVRTEQACESPQTFAEHGICQPVSQGVLSDL